MTRVIEVFGIGCPICRAVAERIAELAPQSARVVVHDLNNQAPRDRAEELGVRAIPAVVIDDRRLACSPTRIEAEDLGSVAGTRACQGSHR